MISFIGSSPLARGLLVLELRLPLPHRIIPARAGFTLQSGKPVTELRDHPRSRGVYDALVAADAFAEGSSPLARGLRVPPAGDGDHVGIIPARAGFTWRRCAGSPRGWDHPRSRGVYLDVCVSIVHSDGSSPLARGLLNVPPRVQDLPGIIPARAGFTAAAQALRRAAADHPRSRGVYRFRRNDKCPATGSSPLARGLLHSPQLAGRFVRIIPARAGFTVRTSTTRGIPGDHPRSRGVYAGDTVIITGTNGSSPLARGLRRQAVQGRGDARIIPARAGFTTTPPSRRRPPRDHPRSRGVYPSGRPGRLASSGSSPLARGLLRIIRERECRKRIIPARAGFTAEYIVGDVWREGSSPLARGLRGTGPPSPGP